jgi:hypothetical protein
MTPTPTPMPPVHIITFGVAANGWDSLLTLVTQAVATVIAILLALWIQRREFRAATKDRAVIVRREHAVIREGWRRTTVADAIDALWAHGDERLFKEGGNQHSTRRALIAATARFRLDSDTGGDQAAEWFASQIRIVDEMTSYARDLSNDAILGLRGRVRGYVHGVEDALVIWQRGSSNEWLSCVSLTQVDSGTSPSVE